MTFDHDEMDINNVVVVRAMKPTQGVRFVGFQPQNRTGESPEGSLSSLANKRYFINVLKRTLMTPQTTTAAGTGQRATGIDENEDVKILDANEDKRVVHIFEQRLTGVIKPQLTQQLLVATIDINNSYRHHRICLQ